KNNGAAKELGWLEISGLPVAGPINHPDLPGQIVARTKTLKVLLNKDFSNLREMYNQVTGQFSMYMGHVVKYIGGIMETPKMVEQTGPVYEIVPRAKQRDAVDFLNKQLFATPGWLINTSIFEKTGISAINTIGGLQDNILNRVLGTRNLSKLIDAEATQENNAYTITELLNDLKKGIWSELPGRTKIDVYRRNLQKSYINILNNLLNPPRSGGSSDVIVFILGGGGSTNIDKSDIKSVVRAHLVVLRGEVKAASASVSDSMSRYHLQDVLVRIDKALDPKE
ncbi:MAG: zinc-dependent metalloprotease, partial [Chitinophagaceae bacterium]